ncbi:MAG TPA: hypothetical protein VFO44_06400 [Steroidobacteraceae bacterium]|nr:hypothetical protein [Steroidobacteraceae bacterium]
MKQTPLQGGEQPQRDSEAPGNESSLASRFRLAMLDEHQGERPGYDPYETTSRKKHDVWSSKPKRA